MHPRTGRNVAVISSAARGLPEYFSAALDVCLRLGIVPVMTEYPAGDDAGAVGAALGLLDEADVYIGISGDAPADLDASIGELESARALKLGIPRLLFTIGSGGRAETEALDNSTAPQCSAPDVSHAVLRAGSPQKFRALLHEALSLLRLRGQTRVKSGSPVAGVTSHRRKGGGDGSAKDAHDGGPRSGRPKRTFRVFVASPGDVSEERALMPKVVESLNRTLGKMLGVAVELWRWEADAPAAAGEPQPLIDPELDEADVVLALFWNRLGTSTSAGPTGTESEVLRSLARWREARRPQVMIYFCQRPALLGREALEQRLRLLEFRERIASLTLVGDYAEAEEFAWRARDDLFVTVGRLCVLPSPA